MDHINKHLHNEGRSTTTQQAGQKEYSQEQIIKTEEVIDQIFLELQAICTAWKQAYSSTEELKQSKRQWLMGFMENGISDHQLITEALGLIRASGGAFFPTVGSFIGFYKKAALTRSGAPETAKAYRMLRGYLCIPHNQRDPANLHPYIYHTLVSPAFDPANFNLMDSEKAIKHFASHYEMTVDHALQGGVIKQCAPKERQIESKPHNPSGIVVKSHREVGKQALDNLKESLK